MNSTIRASSPSTASFVNLINRVPFSLGYLLIEQVAIAAVLQELIVVWKLVVGGILRSCQVMVELLDDHIAVVIERNEQIVVRVSG